MNDRSSVIHELPVLPVRDLVLFPHAMLPVTVGRSATLRALEAVGEDKRIAVVAQRDPQQDEPSISDLYSVGTLGIVLGVARMSTETDASVAFIKGMDRVRIIEAMQREPFLKIRAVSLRDSSPATIDAEFNALQHGVQDLFEEIVQNEQNLSDDLPSVARNIADGSALADFVASLLPLASNRTRQDLLEMLDVRSRLRRLTEELVRVREDQQLRSKIREEVQGKIADTQREYYLREQLKAIQKELGQHDETERDIYELRDRLDKAGLPEEARKEADRELSRLERIPPQSPEYSVARTYIEVLTDLPWQISSSAEVDLVRASTVLDEDHYDLERIKERILEYLAVFRLKQNLKGPILCLVGPPGVGKTSVGRSIARAMGRRFVRISLGGLHDEAEIRGHRRTYVGALPGQIIRSLRRAGTNDPVFMLDEVDKLGRDFRGDPAAALLEVLDPEQNHAFRDNYIDAPFDLSRVLFITTANILDPVPPALRDRMEVLELPGYVDEEKLHIARQYLVPRQLDAHGLEADSQIAFADEGILEIVRRYTHEAGVRALEQRIAAICRKRARQIVGNGGGRLVVTSPVVHELLGVPRFRVETELAERTRIPGVAVALAWTPNGGEILFVEATRMPRDKGEFTITGQVREVMQESARAAMSWLRSNAAHYGIEPRSFHDYDLHIHIPAGAVPKDGPSAGAVMATALASLYTQRAVRPRLALTGEITLSGLVLPVGGVKEKVLAARRSGVLAVVLPEENRPDVTEDIPAHLREGLTFHYVKTIAEAVDHALEPVAAMKQPSAADRSGDWHPAQV